MIAAACTLAASAAPEVAHANPGNAQTSAVPALPDGLLASAADAQRWRQVGQAQLRFFGFDVYRARLWAAPGFAASEYIRTDFALELRYDRDFTGRSIAERSLQEMQRLSPVSDERAQAWLREMQRAFPDVRKGDRLMGVHQGGVVTFVHNGRTTAQVRDAEFARLFFGIWLSERSPEPAMREALVAGARP